MHLITTLWMNSLASFTKNLADLSQSFSLTKNQNKINFLGNILTMNFFISNAYAQSASAQGGGFEMLIMLLLFGVIFYFMLYRPQAKRVKEHKNLVSSLSKGDEVLTQGGIVGRITKVTEEKDFMEISLSDSVNIVIQKASVSAVLPKGTMKNI